MKKIKKIIKELWLDRYEILKILAYVVTGGWFAYVVSIVSTSNSSILGKVFFGIWSLVLVFLFALYKFSNYDD